MFEGTYLNVSSGSQKGSPKRMVHFSTIWEREEDDSSPSQKLLLTKRQSVDATTEIDEDDQLTNEYRRDGYFSDGVTKVDFILVYESEKKDEPEENILKKGFHSVLKWFRQDEEEGSENMMPDIERCWEIEEKRSTFYANLEKHGILIEEDDSVDSMTMFVKLAATWNTARRVAEEIDLRVPLRANLRNDTVTTVATACGSVNRRKSTSKTKVRPKLKRTASKQQRNWAEKWQHRNWSEKWMKKFRFSKNPSEIDVPKHPKTSYTLPFKEEHLDKMENDWNPQVFFKPTQRHRILWEVLQSTSYAMDDSEDCDQIGINQLIKDGVFCAAFPLHDGDARVCTKEDKDTKKKDKKKNRYPKKMTTRQILNYYWAAYSNWKKYQPIDHVREYFGEKIAFYFAWLGFYTAWLIPITLIGVIAFLYGFFTTDTNPRPKEICHSGKTYLMCPRCDHHVGCDYWYLSEACTQSKISYMFDHPGTVFFSIVVSFWAVAFLEFWKRNAARLAYRWDCVEYREEEKPTHEYIVRVRTKEKGKTNWQTNPITGREEPKFSKKWQLVRMSATIGVLLLMVSLVGIFLVGVMVYRIATIGFPMMQSSFIRPYAPMIASITGAIMNLSAIMALSRVYEAMAYKLTTWEMHRTQSEFDNQYTFKVFLFQFMNFYGSVIYIAFFKGRFTGHPGRYNRIFGNRIEECQLGGCFFELAIQLVVIMTGKQIINNCFELFIPMLKTWWHNRKQRKLKKKESGGVDRTENEPNQNETANSPDANHNSNQIEVDVIIHKARSESDLETDDHPDVIPDIPRSRTTQTIAHTTTDTDDREENRIKARWEKDYQLIEYEGLFPEYLEMVIQFGFITIFAAAFPLAPFFALVNNWVEIRLDAQKLVRYTRRPVAEQAQDIGIWFSILTILTHLAIISNALLIAFTSQFLPQLAYRYMHNFALEGYVNFTLAHAPLVLSNGDFDRPCRYEAFRAQDGRLTYFFWHLLAARLAFVICFEHFVFLLDRVIMFIVPDTPRPIKNRIKREQHVIKEVLVSKREDETSEVTNAVPSRRHSRQSGRRQTIANIMNTRRQTVAFL